MPMNGAQTGDTSTAHEREFTVDDAAQKLAGLFPDEGDESTDEPQQDEAETPDEVTPDETPDGDDEQTPTDEDEKAPVDEDTEPSETDEDGAEEADPKTQSKEPDPNTPIKITIDGKEETVTLDEAKKGYLRQADYTRKTQAVSQEKAQVTAARTEYATKLQQVASALTALTPQEPDWATLQAQDPENFAANYAQWQIHQNRQAAIQRELQSELQKLEADHAAQRQAHLESQRAKLLEFVPEWADTAKRTAGQKELTDYAASIGFDEQALAGIDDARVLNIVRKAMLYDRGESTKAADKAKVVEKVTKKVEAVKTVKPGNTIGRKAPVTELTRAKQRLAKTGSEKDAADVIRQQLGL